MPEPGTRVYTVGHGARPASTLLAVLREAEIELVWDIRRFPGSRRHPQFGRSALAAALAEAGIAYEWEGPALGGRRSRAATSRHTALRNRAFAGYADHMDTAEFRAAVERLQEQAARTRSAIMCAETLWWQCHRMLVADALTMRGVEVVHLLQPGQSQPHRPHPAARRGDDGWPVYDVG
ncbi:MAG TPA: DUF488 domain-containing protein [Natronosporangium sp.]|nr:DUF488 domain-containing protein [Natronosporangium sp.]